MPHKHTTLAKVHKQQNPITSVLLLGSHHCPELGCTCPRRESLGLHPCGPSAGTSRTPLGAFALQRQSISLLIIY